MRPPLRCEFSEHETPDVTRHHPHSHPPPSRPFPHSRSLHPPFPPLPPPPPPQLSYDLTYTVDESVRDLGLPSVPKSLLNRALSLVHKGQVKRTAVLDGVRGRLRPGTSTLLLGSPGSGKTVLLRMLSGRMAPDAGTPQVLFNGKSTQELAAAAVSVSKLATFAPQEDIHEPLLTVRETFQFAHDSCAADPAALGGGASSSPDLVAEHAGRVDRVLDVLGLREAENTMIGNEMVRGVSGGQRKRVTIGEAVLSNARVLCLDEITNGLDSAVAQSIVAFLTGWARATQGTVLAALQAPTPEVVALFDDLLLLAEGRVLYHGPRSDVERYLREAHGFVRPSYVDMADFLTALVTSPPLAAELTAQAHHHHHTHASGSAPAPVPLLPTLLTTKELADAWRASPECAAQLGGVVTAKKAEANADADTATGTITSSSGVQLLSPYARAQYGGSYVHPLSRHYSLLLGRQIKLVKRNPPLGFARVTQGVIMGLIIGSLFFAPDPSNFPLRFALALFAATFLSFGNMAEIPAVDTSKRVVYRQTASSMYPETAYLGATLTSHFPFASAGTLLFAILLYRLSNYVDDPGRFFFFYLVLISHELALSAIFRTFAFLAPTMELGQALAGATTGVMLVFGGFLLTFGSIPKFCLPLFFLSPFAWTVRSIAINEFEDPSYAVPVAPFPGAPERGRTFMAAFGFADAYIDFFSTGWKWGGVGVLLFYWLAFGIGFSAIVLKRVRYDYARGTQRLEGAAPSAATTGSPAAAATLTLRAVADKADAESSSMPAPAPEPTAAAVVVVANPVRPVAPASSPASFSASASLPFVPTTLAFTDVTYDVFNPRIKKTVRLLRGVSGYARPGSMTALMGASGAGKTTLMDVLASRKTMGSIGGTVRLNGAAVTGAAFSRIACYVEQDDLLWPHDTVEETLVFSAALRLPAAVAPPARGAYVASLLDVLELRPLAGRIVSSLSPGERKRLSIGVELAANPSLLFLDEPTSGLDARSASVVVRVLRNIATLGRTVVCTIHQPNAITFLSFDQLLLLAPGGRQVYCGPLHADANVSGEVERDGVALVDFFHSIPAVPRLSEGVNPASWMLEVLDAGSGVPDEAKGAPTPKEEEGGAGSLAANAAAAAAAAAATPAADGSAANASPSKVAPATNADEEAGKASRINFPAFYAASPLAASNAEAIAASLAPPSEGGESAAAASAVASASAARPGFSTQFALVLRRGLVGSWRNSALNGLRVINLTFLSLLFGLLYLQIDDSTQQGLVSKIATILNGGGFAGVLFFTTSLPTLFRERPIFYRERAANYYSPEAYSLSVALVDIPWAALCGLVFLSINYFLVGFRADGESFFTMYLGIVALAINWTWIAQWFCACFPNVRVAQIVGGIQISLTFLFAGVFIPVVDMPAAWKGFYYTFSSAQSLRLMALPQFRCDDAVRAAGACPTISAIVNGVPSIVDKQHYVESQRIGMAYEDRWEALGWMVVIGLVFRIMTVLAYRRLNFQKR
jgi:ABC-type multidrug transport system ATPase subunit/ABC-type multidrug transport system permease subunit